MRLVLDTNVVFSALLWGRQPRLILDAAREGQVQLFISRPMLDELNKVLSRPEFWKKIEASGLSPNELVHSYEALAHVVQPAVIPRTSIDPDDDVVLATAKAAKADLIVSGDRHLLTIASFEGIPVVKVVEALGRAGIIR